jgi:hypothetical protein
MERTWSGHGADMKRDMERTLADVQVGPIGGHWAPQGRLSVPWLPCAVPSGLLPVPAAVEAIRMSKTSGSAGVRFYARVRLHEISAGPKPTAIRRSRMLCLYGRSRMTTTVPAMKSCNARRFRFVSMTMNSLQTHTCWKTSTVPYQGGASWRSN